jgi:hypothetical protein
MLEPLSVWGPRAPFAIRALAPGEGEWSLSHWVPSIGAHVTTRRRSQAHFAGSHHFRGHTIRFGDFPRGLRVGHLPDRSRLASAARSKVDICEQLTKEPILTTMVAIPKPRQNCDFHVFAIAKTWKCVLLRNGIKPRKHIAGQNRWCSNHGMDDRIQRTTQQNAGNLKFCSSCVRKTKAKSIRDYFAACALGCSNSARWCFHNLAMPVVPWPRVSSLVGMST